MKDFPGFLLLSILSEALHHSGIRAMLSKESLDSSFKDVWTNTFRTENSASCLLDCTACFRNMSQQVLRHRASAHWVQSATEGWQVAPETCLLLLLERALWEWQNQSTSWSGTQWTAKYLWITNPGVIVSLLIHPKAGVSWPAQGRHWITGWRCWLSRP